MLRLARNRAVQVTRVSGQLSELRLDHVYAVALVLPGAVCRTVESRAVSVLETSLGHLWLISLQHVTYNMHLATSSGLDLVSISRFGEVIMGVATL